MVPVSASYEVSCLNEDVTACEETIRRGTSYGAGIVTGTISGLSDDELGPMLRRDKDRIPKRVKALVKKCERRGIGQSYLELGQWESA